MNVNRRRFLLFFAGVGGTLSRGFLPKSKANLNNQIAQAETSKLTTTTTSSSLSFQPVKVPLPLEIDKLTISQQIETYKNFEVQDDLVLPVGFTYDLVAQWGDRVGESRFGYNNDYLSLVETAPGEGYLTVNFEYISGGTWMQTYPLIIGKQIPFEQLIAATTAKEGEIDAFSLKDNTLKTQIIEISREGLIDQGIGVISVKRNSEGIWSRSYSQADRRITGISGLDNPQQFLRSTGAAVAVFTKPNKLGHEDNLGDRIVGTFQNCAGGTTPWGTVLSAEENFQDQVPEAVMADGSSFPPSDKPFLITTGEINGRGNVFGLAGNKYGWMVEVDPANPKDYGTKHTWLGRYRHEAFGVRATIGRKLAVYSGCDRRGGHLYKFISQDKVIDLKDKANSNLFSEGMLYGAKLYPNGVGEWIPLSPNTIVNPVSPLQVAGDMVILPNSDRKAGGMVEVKTETEMQLLISGFQTLGDMYQGNSPKETQGAILIDAHFAATAAGVTCTARPESTIVAEDGSLFIAFTSGASGSDGGADKAIFTSPEGDPDYEYGWIMKLEEDKNDPAALSFTWSMLATGGEVAQGGAGFANPDNLILDKKGNQWMVTDMSTSVQNEAIPTRTSELGERLSGKELTGVFGNNSLWYIPLSGDDAGASYPFAIGPMECECTGITFDADNSSLFMAVQHPGERNGTRQDMATETRELAMLATNGSAFMQQRQVAIGSNWPSGRVNQPPIPGIVAIRRKNGNEIV